MLSNDDYDSFMREVMQELAELSQRYFWRGLPLPATLFGLQRDGTLLQLAIQDSVNGSQHQVVRRLQALVITKGLQALALALEAEITTRRPEQAPANAEVGTEDVDEVILLEFQASQLPQRMVVIPLIHEVFSYDGEDQHLSQADWNAAYRADGFIVSDFQVLS